jgi:hypothetical protein
MVVDEADGRAARAGVEHRDVLVQLGDVVLGLGLAAVLLLGVGPGGEEVPARAAGGLRVGGDHFHARLDQIVPVLDLLGIALAHQEHDGRGVRRAGLRQALLPVLGQQLAELADLVDVAGQGQGHHVGLEAVDHRAGLLARAAVRLLHGHRLVALGLPVLAERGVVLLVQLAGRIVGHVEQAGLRLHCGAEGQAGEGGQGETTNGHAVAPCAGLAGPQKNSRVWR